jgi:hypothetical protein
MAAAPEILGQSSRVTEAQRGSVLEHFWSRDFYVIRQ